jgi:Flp pilus assembly protein TadD
LRRSPQSPFGYFLLGSIYKQSGKLPEAERALRQALTLDPAMARVRLELVNIYLSQGKKDDASHELRAFLEQSPQDPLAPKARDLLKKLETHPN